MGTERPRRAVNDGTAPKSGPPSNPILLLQDACARVVVILEALEDGEPSTAYVVATDLEMDIAAAIARAA